MQRITVFSSGCLNCSGAKGNDFEMVEKMKRPLNGIVAYDGLLCRMALSESHYSEPRACSR